MVAGAFPLIKLGALALRQISKPIANALKTRAKTSPFFRNYVCMPPAQLYHWIEVNVKMKLLGLGKPTQVQKLNEAMAIDLGAELLGETFMFLTAVGTVGAEYIRQTRKAAAELAAQEERWNKFESRVEELEFITDKQSAEIRELLRLCYALQTKQNIHNSNNSLNSAHSHLNSDKKHDQSENKGLLGKAIEDVSSKLSGKSK